jgi:hypothetical protein
MRGLLAAGLLLTGCTGSSNGAGAAAMDGGPLREPPEHAYVVQGKEGKQFTDGFEVLYLNGDQAATIVSVRSMGGDDAFKFLGARLAGPDRKYAALQETPQFPPTDPHLGPLIDAEGATVEPRSQTRQRIGYELLLGYEIVDDSKLGKRDAVEVTYKVGGTTYRWTSSAGLIYCPADEDLDVCLHAGEDDSNYQSHLTGEGP